MSRAKKWEKHHPKGAEAHMWDETRYSGVKFSHASPHFLVDIQ